MTDDKAFAHRAAETLKRLERACTDLDDRLEADLAGDVLTLEFADGRKYIVNSHSAARQVWVSAEARAWHLSWDEVSGRWIDTREGRELWSLIGEVVSKKLGKAVPLSP
jgi:CyaY protein